MKIIDGLLQLLLSCTVALCATSCGYINSNKEVQSTNGSLRLTEDQIYTLSKAANTGNSDAAFRLYEYYLYIQSDLNEAIKWLSVAATNGSAVAQYSMGMTYDGELYSDLVDLNKAKYWFNKASLNGYTNATVKLKEVNSTRQPEHP